MQAMSLIGSWEDREVMEKVYRPEHEVGRVALDNFLNISPNEMFKENRVFGKFKNLTDSVDMRYKNGRLEIMAPSHDMRHFIHKLDCVFSGYDKIKIDIRKEYQ